MGLWAYGPRGPNAPLGPWAPGPRARGRPCPHCMPAAETAADAPCAFAQLVRDRDRHATRAASHAFQKKHGDKESSLNNPAPSVPDAGSLLEGTWSASFPASLLAAQTHKGDHRC